MVKVSNAPTHEVAQWLLKNIDGVLNHLGLENHQSLEEFFYVLVISLISVLIGIILKKVILFVTNKILTWRQSTIAVELRNRRVFIKCSHIIPPLVFMALVPFAFDSDSNILHWIFKIVGIYSLIAFAVGINSILKFVFDRYNLKENRKNLPLKGVLNIAIGTVWIVIAILCICILIDKSPAAILAGLGAFAAALLLIFKDSILGFVAGIQISDNDMLHIGDWIVVPGTPANGIVTDVSLSTVKIQNWNLSTVMVPPYTLVSTSFQNYKSMYDLGCRQIENSFIIDIESIKPVSDELIQSVVDKYPVMSPFLDSLKKDNATVASLPGIQAVNGTTETNMGLFRAYVGCYLTSHPMISKERRILVRIMQGTNAGIPLQIWCFTTTTEWSQYEGIQSEIMEHISAAATNFGGLRIYSANAISVDRVPDATPTTVNVTSAPTSQPQS